MRYDIEEPLSLPIYLDEVARIRHLAELNNQILDLQADLMYFDELNNRLIIVTYALIFDENGCPFHKTHCIIYKERPITCKAYPIVINRIEDTTNMIIEPECSFVQENNEILRTLDYYELSDVFPNEFAYAREIQIRGNAITNKLQQLEEEGKVQIPVKLPVEHTDEIKNMEKVRLDKLK